MNPSLFCGSGCAIVTPMLPDGSIHLEALGKLIDYQLDNETDAIIICGTTGEAATLSDKEQQQLIEYTVKKVNHRVPVIAGAGSNNTAHAVELCKSAHDCGADGLLCVTPYYNKTSQKGLVKHFEALADATDLPMILYNVPSRTGCNLTAETCKILSNHPNICGVKEASGNLSQIAEISRLCGEDFAVYSGNDDQILPVLSLGGKGVISVLANVLPKETHDICALYRSGKTDESHRLQLKLLPLIHSLFSDVNPIPVKEALNLMGFSCGACRLPLWHLDEGKRTALTNELKACGLLS